MFQTVSCLILDPKCIFKTVQRGNLIPNVFFLPQSTPTSTRREHLIQAIYSTVANFRVQFYPRHRLRFQLHSERFSLPMGLVSNRFHCYLKLQKN